MNDELISNTALALLRAYGGTPIAPIRPQVTDVATAYAIQRRTIEAWQAGGRRIVGRKIGITSVAVQQQLGVEEPDFGALFDDMVLQDGATVPAGAVVQPRVEAEIAFVLARDLRGEGITAQQVIEATDHVVPALEICGSRIAGWDIKITDTVADNASSALVVLGRGRRAAALDDLPGVPVKLLHNGATASEGTGAACLGNPANAVAWLANALGRFGDHLRAGDLVMSGAMCRMVPAAPGDAFAADFGDWGSVSVRFAA